MMMRRMFSVCSRFKRCGVHADHDQLIGILRLEFFQVRNNVDAVDAAIGPQNPAAQLSL